LVAVIEVTGPQVTSDDQVSVRLDCCKVKEGRCKHEMMSVDGGLVSLQVASTRNLAEEQTAIPQMTIIRRFLAVISAAAMVSLASAQDGKLKIATVDMQELFKQYYKTNDAQKQINVERARIQKDNNERLARIRELEGTLGGLRKQLEDPTINESKKQQLFKDWQMQQQEGIALDRERREFLQRRNQALNEKMVQRMKGILEEIRKLVEEQAKTDNFDYVFDKSGLSTSQVPFLLYTKDATDITAGLLKDLNKDAPAESLPTPGEPTPELPGTTPAPAPAAE
jgi:outer membrane protein